MIFTLTNLANSSVLYREEAKRRGLTLKDCPELLGRSSHTKVVNAIPPTPRSEIRIVQSHLTELGYSPGHIDGLLGQKTIFAIAAFRSSQDLISNSKFGNNLIVAFSQSTMFLANGTRHDREFKNSKY